MVGLQNGHTLTELQIVGAPAPKTHNFSKWRVTVKVYAPGWRVIKMKNLQTNFDQPVPLSLTTPLRFLQTEYWKQHQITASLRVLTVEGELLLPCLASLQVISWQPSTRTNQRTSTSLSCRRENRLLARQNAAKEETQSWKPATADLVSNVFQR